MTPKTRIQWKWGAFAALAMTVIAIYPQINLWLVRGTDWQGSYVLTQGDEVAYSAYINALIDGRPRRNDPFNGIDDRPGSPTHESLFSIQFVPSYAVALPARAMGVSTSALFIWLIIIAAITSTLAIFWLLATLTGESKLAASGALFTLCFGALAAAQGAARFMLAGQRVHDMFSFLRRYQPSVIFPLFFVFCVFVWRGLTSESAKARLLYSLAAGALFSVLVFSYFFIWTAAAAWFTGVVLLWLIFRRDEFKRVALTSIIVGVCAVVSVIPFFKMLSHRSISMDETQLLIFTHAPDFSYPPEILGFVVLALLGYAYWRKGVEMSAPVSLFTASFALVPFLLFNQQILTGRTLQPIHYKIFVANYVALISIVLLFLTLWRAKVIERSIPSKLLLVVTVASLGWGVIEVSDITQRDAAKARIRDEVLPVAHRLKAMAREDGLLEPALSGKTPLPLVYASSLDVAGSIPSDSPLAVMWALHTPACGMSLKESKERFYQYMYYSGLSLNEVATGMTEGRFIVLAPLFGVERVIEGLAPDPKPITTLEMRDELKHYGDYLQNFGIQQARNPVLNYVVIPNSDAAPNLSNLDKWYERDAGEQVGLFKIYRVKLRTQN